MTISIRIADSEQDKLIADQIVEQHHSYVASSKTVGRCLKYIIKYQNRDVGTFWIGSGFKPTPKAILNFFSMSQSEFDKIFNEVADNKRFCMKEQIPNAGTQILSAIRKRAKLDWFEYYNNELKAIITTIGKNKKGSVYLADNWKKIGETSGLPEDRLSVSMKWNDAEEINNRYVKPDGENKKTILITTNLPLSRSQKYLISLGPKQLNLI
jgi:hypothetical protein